MLGSTIKRTYFDIIFVRVPHFSQFSHAHVSFLVVLRRCIELFLDGYGSNLVKLNYYFRMYKLDSLEHGERK